jgi:ATP-dependent Zn protease
VATEEALSRIDDISRCAARAESRRQKRILLVLVGLFAILAGRDLVRFSMGEPLSFGIHAPSLSSPFAPALVLMVILGAMLVLPMMGLGRSPHVMIRPDDVEFSMDDLLGSDRLKEGLCDLIDEYRHFATLEREHGGKPPRAVLFEGPPGTGKTMAAKVLARESGVPFLFVSASSFQSMYYGQTSRKLRSFFRHLRRLTRRYGGAIGFIEEFDSIGSSRSGLGGGSGREGVAGVVGELLVQLQSFEVPRWSIARLLRRTSTSSEIEPRFLLLAATNRAADLDPALIRPGRFDRIVRFDLPSKAARVAMIEGLLGRRGPEWGLTIDEETVSLVASMSSGMSQAGLNRLIEEASILAWRHGGGMTREDLLEALSRVSLGVVDSVRFDDVQRLRIAVHEVGHAFYTWRRSTMSKVGLVSILKRSSALGLTAMYQLDDAPLVLRSELIETIASSLGGMAAEELFLSEPSTGSSSDLRVATERAFEYLTTYGLGEYLNTVGSIDRSQYTAIVLGEGPLRDELNSILLEAKTRACELLQQESDVVWRVVMRLLSQDELDEAELREILGPPLIDRVDSHSIAIDGVRPSLP